MTTIIIGASGGLGAALARAYRARGDAVIGLSRASTPALDLADEASIAAAAGHLSDIIVDRLVIASGLLHGDGAVPEKSWRMLSAEGLARSFAVNANGPALVARHFLPLMPRDRRASLVALSARVGSIGDNRLGGWYGYRASKAALNQLIRTLSIELARTHPHLLCVAIHPGTVDTALSAPFQRGVAAERLFAPDDSAAHIVGVLDRLSPGDSGGCFDWRGERIPA